VKVLGLIRNNHQRTLAQRVRISGTGLHSGGKAEVILHPAEEGAGIVFGSNGTRVRGLAANVVGTARGTNLGSNGTRFQTVEHLMAALNGMGVDNAFVEVVGAEMPILDGSAMPYVEAICSVGTVALPGKRSVIKLKEPVWVEGKDSFILAVPSDSLKITYVMNYLHPLIGSQTATFEITESSFRREIAPARTFVMYEEVAELVSQELARGGSLDNAIVIWQDKLSSDLRFPDELARHKVLDLVGDLALIGGRLGAEIVAVKSGHALNVKFVRKLTSHIEAWEKQQAA
jgi:UDP-3-O-[3-hydroxymyristoyl] N-acetylglucosamine deacetylase